MVDGGLRFLVFIAAFADENYTLSIEQFFSCLLHLCLVSLNIFLNFAAISSCFAEISQNSVFLFIVSSPHTTRLLELSLDYKDQSIIHLV